MFQQRNPMKIVLNRVKCEIYKWTYKLEGFDKEGVSDYLLYDRKENLAFRVFFQRVNYYENQKNSSETRNSI
jgi:adenine C2-methylase RlmN of 23S rRNA A2503 and tRNA A37